MQSPPSTKTGTPLQSKFLASSQDRKTIPPKQHLLHYSPNDTKAANWGPEPHGTHRPKHNWTADSDLITSPTPRSKMGGTKSRSRNRQHTDSPVQSVRFSDPKYYVYYPSYACEYPESVPSRDPKTGNLPRTDAPLDALSVDINAILYALVTFIKLFKCPTHLYFCLNVKDPLQLVNNDTNRPFINQLCKIKALRTKLAGIPTYGDAKLKKQHRAVGMAIERALQSMQKHQLILYERFRESNDPLFRLNNLLTRLDGCVKSFERPSQLDFFPGKNSLARTTRNEKFISQLHRLDEFRDELNKIPTCDDGQSEQMHKYTSVAIGRALQMLKAHQLELYERHIKVYRTPRA
ncbi:unnamed protein product [Rhizoctonia solani]|uniref:Uncharacterized protein n=1 Tax=Rhizoctonia solani TaxID=456999 RepID=A0A8H3C7Z6_9AGAM|nr:unnamed protein product [Rhizoctonia solani]